MSFDTRTKNIWACIATGLILLIWIVICFVRLSYTTPERLIFNRPVNDQHTDETVALEEHRIIDPTTSRLRVYQPLSKSRSSVRTVLCRRLADTRPRRLMVRTPALQVGNAGSIPAGTTTTPLSGVWPRRLMIRTPAASRQCGFDSRRDNCDTKYTSAISIEGCVV